MKNLIMILFAMLIMAGCQSTYQSASSYDDVYYSPNSTDQVMVQKRVNSATPDVSYGNNASDDRFENTTQPQSEIIGSDNYPQKSSSVYYQDTLAQSESTSNEYSYSEDSDEYYDYEYASRIRRFNQDYDDFGYYSPVYSNFYGGGYSPGFSMGYGWGWPSSYFSLSYNYGWGYPYYRYYDPWYSWYDPWYYPYYGFGGSYWMGYNQGYYNGYWNGYYAGGYYPEGGGSGSGYHYGPRGTRGGGLIGSTENRESRITNNVNVEKTTPVQTRESRIETGATDGSASSQQSGGSVNNGRVNRQTDVQQQQVTPSANEVTRDARAEKLAKPSSSVPTANTEKNESIIRETRNTTGVNSESTKLSKPVIKNEASGVAQDRNTRTSTTTQQQKLAKPEATQGNSNVVQREKKYAKPASNNLQKPAQTKNYSSPTYNKPRSSNEYTVPGSRTIRTVPQSEGNSERGNVAPAQQNNVRTSTPSKSNSSFTSPGRSNLNNTSRPAKTYTSPSRSTPQRSYSPPARSSSGGSYSAPSSSGSSRSSGSSSGGSSSGSNSGRRGR